MTCPRYQDNDATLYVGDCREVLASLPEASVDAVVTDPPYELGFMGKGWDSAGVSFRPETWAASLRVLKPGGHLLAFGGSRTFHRIACAIEDAGFEVRDTLTWLYGQGFPKSLNLGDGRGTALKPAWEPVILARKPLVGTVAANVQAHGTGALNIDACRIGTSKDVPASVSRTSGRALSGSVDGSLRRETGDEDGHNPNVGRWPANVVLDEEAAAALDAQSGMRRSSGGFGQVVRRKSHASLMGLGIGAPTGVPEVAYGDSGGASRFFFVAKASRSERDAGCESLPARSGGEATDREDGSAGTNSPRAGAGRTGGARNIHPTVKPVALMRWLVRLVTPPGGVVLDPFMGSGTTGVAVMQEGRRFVGIEQSAEYMEIARCRVAHAVATLAPSESPRQRDLFGGQP